MVTALYAGSFDPITYGHLDIIKQGTEIFDKVIVGVAYNPEKQGFLPIGDRIKLIEACVNGMPNVGLAFYSTLTVEFAKENNAQVLLRGIRNSSDFEYEKQLAEINSKLEPSIKTVFLTAIPEHASISSSAVRELILHKQNLNLFVPEPAAEFLYEKFGY